MNDTNRKWYQAKDIRTLLGVTSGQLFHWGQTWGLIQPEIKAKGRAFKDRYSFRNLLDIALVKELNALGFEPSKIGEIIAPFEHGKGNVWDYFKDGRNDSKDYDEDLDKWITFPGYDKEGFLLLIERRKDGEYSIGHPGSVKDILGYLGHIMKEQPDEAPRSNIIINLSRIIQDLEERTGEKL